jgi:nitrous oxidase accessory protein NosD
MLRISVIIPACLLSLFMVMLVAGFASAQSKGHVVRPGESIQAAVDAAEPGDTIQVLGGVHRETVVIEKNGISLQGVKAVLEPPTEPPEGTCEGAGFCILGDVDFDTGEVAEYVKDVSISGFTVRNFSEFGIVGFGARDAKFVQNRTFNDGEYGITSFFSTGTQVISNVTSGAEDAAIYVGDSPRAKTKIVNNDTYDSSSGILVRNSLHGRIIANNAHDNCIGILFIADAPGPAGEFDVNFNKVHDNTGACPATVETPALSGVGIGLLGARDVEIHGNHILDNVPSDPQALSGGVLVVRGIEGTPPTNNTVIGNMILRNEPDIFWDESGSGNRFVPNNCETSVPEGFCKR